MYDQVAKENVLTELNNSADLFCVDFQTLRVMRCADMTLSAVKSFIDKPEAMFFKRVVNG